MNENQGKIKLDRKVLNRLEIDFIRQEKKFLPDKNKTETEKVTELYSLIKDTVTSKSVL